MERMADLEDGCESVAAGCSDGCCVIKRPKGMHTNGGCRCLRDLRPPMRSAVRKRLTKLKELAGAMRVAIEEMDEAGIDTRTFKNVCDEAYELF